MEDTPARRVPKFESMTNRVAAETGNALKTESRLLQRQLVVLPAAVQKNPKLVS